MKFLKLKKVLYSSSVLIFLIGNTTAYGDDVVHEALNNLKSIWDGVNNFVSGIGQSFGYVPDNYRYSLRVWNDSPGVVRVVTQDLKKIFEAGFSGKVTQTIDVAPFENTNDFLDQHLYFALWLLKNAQGFDYTGYKESVEIAEKATAVFGLGIASAIGGAVTTGELKNYELYSKVINYPMDTSYVNFYRAYTSKGEIKAEALGVKTTTNEFTGVFYNSSDTDIVLQFMKDGVTYKATLEKGTTFSLLNSSPGKSASIRPPNNEVNNQRAFIFFNGSQQIAAMPIKSEGICNVQEDPATKKLIPGSPMVYTYEVSQGKIGVTVSLQGLSIGNYTQPIDQKNWERNVVRDINPMECHVWYQSAKQAQQAAQEAAKKENGPYDPSQLFYDSPDSVWLFYKTKDYTFQKKVISGQVVDFTLLRPQLSENSEKQVRLFCAMLQTQDDTKALNFLNRLADGKIGKDAVQIPGAPVLTFDEKTVLTALQPNKRGLIDDTAGSGITGSLLFSDLITSHGVGTGPFYYMLQPPLAQLSDVVAFFKAYLDPKKFTSAATMQQDILSKVQKWIADYPKNKSGVVTEVTNYLQEKGIDATITDPSASQRVLNEDGKRGVRTLVEGSVSIAKYPLRQQAGSNEYVYYFGDKPLDWPSK